MADLPTLIKQRGVLKSQLTSFTKFIRALENPSNIAKRNTKKGLEKIETIIDHFEEIQNKINLLDLDDEKNMQEREKFENDYYEIIAIATTLIENDVDQNNSDNNSIGSNSSVSHMSQRGAAVNVKLPKIELPHFDGEYTAWQQFYDSFVAMIHNNESLSNVQKLCYLKGQLRGEPANMLVSLKTIDSNYEIAFNSLCKRYNKKRRIIDKHVREILNLESVGIYTRGAHIKLRKFINDLENNMQCLESLGQPVDSWDAILMPIILSKLDEKLTQDWEGKINSREDDEMPRFSELINFLNIKQNTLESMASMRMNLDTTSKKATTNRENFKPKETTKSLASVNTKCVFCDESHYILNCDVFLALDASERIEKVKKLRLCLNCLKRGHYVTDCKSSMCKICGKRHHTLLHMNLSKCSNEKTVSQEAKEGSTTLTTLFSGATREVLLSTASVNVLDARGNIHKLRVLLDSGSQSSFITSRACKKLNLQRKHTNLRITGLNQEISSIKQEAEVNIRSRFCNYEAKIKCFVLENIAGHIPTNKLNIKGLNIPANITLADEEFHKPKEIDILIGAELFWDLLCIGQIREPNGAVFQKTKLGWIIAGALQIFNAETKRVCLFSRELQDSMQRFWELEEVTTEKRHLSTEEEACETLFQETTRRHHDGKFIVKLPLKENLGELGDSYEEARKRFLSLEQRFARNAEFKEAYSNVINDYIDQNHMSETNAEEAGGFYLPHHAVIKSTSETTKLRIVFDGSCRLQHGKSINEVQHGGPTIQDDLFSILVRFRTYKYVVTADIAQMYRQVWLHEEQRKYQRILWRENPNDELKSYTLNTVTFGMTAAPFLAIRCLFEIANTNEQRYPNEAEIIRRDFYVDDLLTGSNAIADLETIKTNIGNILSQGGFNLRKWRDNYTNSSTPTNLLVQIPEVSKILGLYWNNEDDTFLFRTNTQRKEVTKRSILSTTAQLFDPMGLIAPVIVIAKLLIQELWQLKLSWDESIPSNLYNTWTRWIRELETLKEIEIPRLVLASKPSEIQMHGFCDASEKAYGACVYLRSRDTQNDYTIKLLAAKSRVAPLKKVTLPRLELLGAVLLAQLMSNLRQQLSLNVSFISYWSDSQIALSWIKASPAKWKTFVANRVTLIQELTNIADWHHVKSKDNPADILSRGCYPSQLSDYELWWNGPTFLTHDFDYQDIPVSDLATPEERRVKALLTTQRSEFPFERFSSFNHLVRTFAWCLRFKENAANSMWKRSGNLSLDELNRALTRIIRLSQMQAFSQEHETLKRGKQIDKKSKILSLNPFLDKNDLIRVGGRLSKANLKFDEQHPVLLPKNAKLTKLIFEAKHKELLHAGPMLLLSTVRQKYWPISGMNIAKQTVHRCMRCFRFNSRAHNVLMGDLPTERTAVMSPFHTVGLDYGGPVIIKERAGRCNKTNKAYICLFVCFATKAIHLEAVSSLTTNAFLAALRRFIARRGKPKTIFSDNGTNFIGANKQLKELYDLLLDNEGNLKNVFAVEKINWQFIPPHTPHFGGIWEAGIKSVKQHLRKVTSGALLTFEELSTVLSQIESILNSRPLTQMSSDPHDFQVLTPAHFLIGRPYTLAADQDVTDMNVPRLDRLQYLQRIVQQFWQRWSREYLTSLQQRNKWKQRTPNINVGSLVLIREDNFPPSKWRIGRVSRCFPGADEQVRVVDVKCENGVIRRPVVKLCPLPIEGNETNPVPSEHVATSEGSRSSSTLLTK